MTTTPITRPLPPASDGKRDPAVAQADAPALAADAVGLLPKQVAARYPGLTEHFLKRQRLAGGDVIPHIRVSRKTVMYLVEDIEAWLASRRRRSTSDLGPSGGKAA
jgi:hypothetical protein